jgi:2-C-methyl-D-erythritol 4-phosphate cytidylyltransferase
MRDVEEVAMAIAVIFPVVTPAYAGRGASRAFSKIDGREVFLRSVELYTPRDQVKQRIVVATPSDLQEMQERYSAHLGFQGVEVTAGGSDWFSCVGRGIEKLKPEIDIVIVHDPCCPAVGYLLLNALEEALTKNREAAGVVPILPSRSAFADVEGARLADYVDMAKVVEVQAPQIFRRAALERAYGARGTATFVDDGELVASAGGKIVTIPGSRFNMRIDSDDMVRLGKDLLEHMPKPKARTPLAAFGEAEW